MISALTVITAIEVASTVVSVGEKIADGWSDIRGDCGQAVTIANYSPDLTLQIEYISQDSDKGQHGKFSGTNPPPVKVPTPGAAQMQSLKGDWTTYGNTNGVVYRVKKTGCEKPLYLHVCWESPYFGAGFYHIQLKSDFKKEDMKATLLKDLGSRSVGDTSRFHICGLQQVSGTFKSADGTESTLIATAAYGKNPLKVFLYEK